MAPDCHARACMASGLPCKTLAWQSGTDADAAEAAAGAAAGTAAV